MHIRQNTIASEKNTDDYLSTPKSLSYPSLCLLVVLCMKKESSEISMFSLLTSLLLWANGLPLKADRISYWSSNNFDDKSIEDPIPLFYLLIEERIGFSSMRSSDSPRFTRLRKFFWGYWLPVWNISSSSTGSADIYWFRKGWLMITGAWSSWGWIILVLIFDSWSLLPEGVAGWVLAFSDYYEFELYSLFSKSFLKYSFWRRSSVFVVSFAASYSCNSLTIISRSSRAYPFFILLLTALSLFYCRFLAFL